MMQAPDLGEHPAMREELAAEAAFDDAFARAQGSFQPILRTRTVEVRMKTGGTYTFAYAPLENILKACLPALNAAGIAFTQKIRIDEGESPDHFLVTLLRRKGHLYSTEVLIIRGEPTPQAYGAAVSYAKRLGASLALGVAVEDDNDGHGEGAAQDGALAGVGPKKAPRRSDPARAQEPAAAPTSTGLAPGLTDEQLEALEGRINDAVMEMAEACAEGRRVGIAQIWDEVKTDQFVAQQVWKRMKAKYPDYFRTMEETLKPKGEGKRGLAALSGA